MKADRDLKSDPEWPTQFPGNAVAKTCGEFEARGCIRNFLSGGYCIEWVIGIGCIARVFPAIPISSFQNLRRRFSFMDVSGIGIRLVHARLLVFRNRDWTIGFPSWNAINSATQQQFQD
jgi:hypothetical protein